jgi:hypothetical protein
MKLWQFAGAAPRIRRSIAVALTILGLHMGAGGSGFAPRAADAAVVGTQHATGTGHVSPVTVQSSPESGLAPRGRRPQHPCEECPPPPPSNR